jgi:hypothetical protein
MAVEATQLPEGIVALLGLPDILMLQLSVSIDGSDDIRDLPELWSQPLPIQAGVETTRQLSLLQL